MDQYYTQPLLSQSSSTPPRTIPCLGSSLFGFGSKEGGRDIESVKTNTTEGGRDMGSLKTNTAEGGRDKGSVKTNTAEARPRYIVKNRRLAVVINVVLNLLYTFLYGLYVLVFTEVLKRRELWTAAGIILFIVNPCFLVIWWILSFYSNAYDDYIVNGDIARKIPSEKTSVLV